MKQPKTVLLVEDSASDVELAERALRKNWILNELIVAKDGQEAMDYLVGTGDYSGRDISDTPALILLDLKIPKIPGLDVLRLIRADPRIRRIPVVILSTSKHESDLRNGYDRGTNSYIRKPIDFQEFTSVIRQLGLYWLVFNETAPPFQGKL